MQTRNLVQECTCADTLLYGVCIGHVVNGGQQSGEHALLLSSSRESTPIDHSKEDGSIHSKAIEQPEHQLAYVEWHQALLVHNLCGPLQLFNLP